MVKKNICHPVDFGDESRFILKIASHIRNRKVCAKMHDVAGRQFWHLPSIISVSNWRHFQMYIYCCLKYKELIHICGVFIPHRYHHPSSRHVCWHELSLVWSFLEKYGFQPLVPYGVDQSDMPSHHLFSFYGMEKKILLRLMKRWNTNEWFDFKHFFYISNLYYIL